MNENIKSLLTKKQITIGQIVTFFIGLALFIFMETQLFRDLNDIIKIIIYIGIYGTFLIFGVELFATKKLALDIRNIIADKKLSAEQMVMQLTQLASETLVRLGLAWEVFDAEQFPEKPEVKAKDLTYETTEGYVDTEHTSSTG